jgi:hypothetical protein
MTFKNWQSANSKAKHFKEDVKIEQETSRTLPLKKNNGNLIKSETVLSKFNKNYKRTLHIVVQPGGNVIKLFFSITYEFCNEQVIGNDIFVNSIKP